MTLVALLASWPACARAQQVISVTNPPVIRMQMRSGSLTIRTWNRPQVQVSSSAPVRARRVSPETVANALPPEITIFSATVNTPAGAALLPPEGFSLGSVPAAPHDGVIIFGGDQNADVTVTIPDSTALLWAAVGRGTIKMNGYRAGTFVTIVHTGGLELQNVSGDGYAEVARGPMIVRDSAFNRFRARTAMGNILFENCNARQILVSSIGGSIAYDDGTFVPGVARFESQNGNVAIGIAGGGARIDAHSAGGRIFSGFSSGAALSGSPTDAQAIVGPGGPVVTANSVRGAVYLYDGSLRSHGPLKGPWQPLERILRRPLQQKLPHRRHI